jgi:predicted amidohydrolase YtcJ
MNLLKLVSAIGLGIAFSLQSFGATLFHNGTIRTMDSNNPTVEAVLIDNKIITAIGSKKELEKITAKQSSKKLTLVDLKGNTLLPGFIDSHVHVRELGMDAVKANLVGTNTSEEMVERLRAKFPKPTKGEWLIGQGWDEGKFASIGYPDRSALDKAFPNNPIQLESLHGFAGFYNARALEIAGITITTEDPKVGQILRRSNGQASGVLLTLAQSMVNKHVPEPSLETRKKAIVAGLNLMAAAGVSSVHEAGMTESDVEAFIALRKENLLPIRVYGMLNGNDKELMQYWFQRGPLIDATKMLEVRGVKVFYDGSLGSRTAMLKAPYSDHPEKANPTERITPEDVLNLGQNSAQSGFQMAVHAIGDEGNNRTLAIYEESLAPFPNLDARWRIEHAQVVLADFYKRAANIGVVASMQSSHAIGDSGWAEDRLGKDRIQHAYAWQKMLAAGIPLAMNSDLPGEPWQPMKTLYFAVTRTRLDGTPAEGWYKEEALSGPEALTAMTITNAYAAFQDPYIGSIKVGKFADFVILDKDPLRVKDATLKSIEVLQTWVAGAPAWTKDNIREEKLVYERVPIK